MRKFHILLTWHERNEICYLPEKIISFIESGTLFALFYLNVKRNSFEISTETEMSH